MATMDPNLHQQQAADAARMKAELEQYVAMANARPNTGILPNMLGDGSILGAAPVWSSGGYVPSGYAPMGATAYPDPRDAENARLRGEIDGLRMQVMRLKQAIENPDLPVAQKVSAFIDSVDDEEVTRRTAPPFNEDVLSSHIMRKDKGRAISADTMLLPLRNGTVAHVRVVGLIVREEYIKGTNDWTNATPAATYMVPTRHMNEGDAREAIADLVADITMRRVLKQMGESNEPAS